MILIILFLYVLFFLFLMSPLLFFSDMLPDILQTGCARCSPFVKGNVNRLIRYAQQKYPKEWARIKVKYGKHNKGR
jgi:Insect pheromone-binding family, A10/OS-D